MNVNDTEILICNCGKTMPLDPKKITPGCQLDEEVKNYNPVWLSGQNRATCPEITRFGIACVPLGMDEIFLQILNALGMG